MKTTIFLLGFSCLLLACSGHGPTPPTSTLSGQDTLSFRAELDSARHLLRRGATDRAEFIASGVLAASVGDPALAKQHMHALSTLGQVQQRRSQLDSAFSLYSELLHVAEEVNDTFWIGAAWVNIGVVRDLQGDYPGALDAGLKALHWKELLGDSASLARVLHNLSVLEWRQDSVSKAIALIDRSIAIKRTHDALSVASSLAGLGVLLIEAQQYDSAIHVLRESVLLEDSLAEGAERENAVTNLALAFEKLGMLDTAAYYHTMALGDARAHDNTDVVIRSLYGIAEVRRAQGQYAQALPLLDSSLALARRIGSQEDIKHAHYALVETNERMGNVPAALHHLRAYQAVNDSLMNGGTQAAMEELRMRYQNEKRDLENKELRATAELTTLRAERNRWIALGMTLLAMSMALVGWVLVQRNKQGARQREADLEQQALRLQMDPHFLFNALNTIPGLYASGDHATANDHVGHLSKFLRLVLETSRKRTIPLAQEIELVEHYLRINTNRRSGSFTWEVNVMPSLNPELLAVPPMLVQPLVENALEHGLGSMAKGHISVLIDLVDGVLHIAVQDNGIGRQASARRPTRRNGPSMGIELVRQRIQLFDPACRPGNAVQVRDELSEKGTASGTTVTLSFRPQPITEHAPDSHRG